MLSITLLSDNILKILSGLIPIACKVQWHFLHLINHCNYSMPRKDADPRKGFSHLVSKNVPSLISVTSPKRFTSGEQPSHSTEEEIIKSWTNSESKIWEGLVLPLSSSSYPCQNFVAVFLTWARQSCSPLVDRWVALFQEPQELTRPGGHFEILRLSTFFKI